MFSWSARHNNLIRTLFTYIYIHYYCTAMARHISFRRGGAVTLFGYPSTHNPSTDSSVACLVVGGGGGGGKL